MKRYTLSPRGKRFPLTDDMIALRDNLARGLGYVLRRPCSIGGDFECWEREALTHEHRGRMISAYHCHRSIEVDGDRDYHWPENVEVAAWAIDKGKAAASPASTALPLPLLGGQPAGATGGGATAASGADGREAGDAP